MKASVRFLDVCAEPDSLLEGVRRAGMQKQRDVPLREQGHDDREPPLASVISVILKTHRSDLGCSSSPTSDANQVLP